MFTENPPHCRAGEVLVPKLFEMYIDVVKIKYLKGSDFVQTLNIGLNTIRIDLLRFL